MHRHNRLHKPARPNPARDIVRRSLPWLPGVPLFSESGGLSWLKFTSNKIAQRQLDDETFRLAHRGIKSLKQDPRVLRHDVKDPSKWIRQIEHLLSHLQSKDLYAQSLDCSEFFGARWQAKIDALWQDHSALRPLLTAIQSLRLSSQQRFDGAMLAWITNHAEPLGRMVQADLQMATILKICHLRAHLSSNLVTFLVAVLCREKCPATELQEALAEEYQLKRKLAVAVRWGKPARPHHLEQTFELKKAVINAVDDQYRSGQSSHRAFFDLLAVLSVPELVRQSDRQLDAARARCRQLQRELRRCEMIGGIAYVTERRANCVTDVVYEDNDAEHTLSAWTDVQRIIPQLEGCPVRLLGAFASFFCLIPEFTNSQGLRLISRWLDHARRRRCRNRQTEESLERVIRAFCRLIKSEGLPSYLLNHWKGFADRSVGFYGEAVCRLHDGLLANHGIDRWPRVVEFIRRACFKSNAAEYVLDKLYEFATVGSPDGSTIDVLNKLKLLRQHPIILSRDVKSAFTLARNANEATACLVALGNHEQSDTVEKLLSCNLPPDLHELVRRLLIRNQSHSKLHELTTLLRAIGELGAQVPSLPELVVCTNWVKEFPLPLQTALRKLAEQDEHAEETAERILLPYFQTTRRLHTEISKLNHKLNAGTLDQARCEKITAARDKLAQRLNTSAVIGDGRMHKLIQKIERRRDDIQYQKLIAACHRSVQLGFCQQFPGSRVSPRLFQTPYKSLLPAVLRLEGALRRIGLRLLAGCDKDAKNRQPLARENSQFVAKMNQRGVCMKPWFDAIHPTIAHNRHGQPFQLAFETDALELLLMGYHFRTCLSPDDFNFYSAITNTIDVNKQVLYCRRADGRVIGRCLFALTSDGKIQNFERYDHGTDIEFDRVVDEFAIRLATAMGTSLTTSGTVKPLVANKWYDDGAVQGGLSRTRFSDDTSPVGKLIQDTDAQDLIRELVQLFGSIESVRSNLDSLIALATRVNKSALVPLASQFAFDSSVGIRDRLELTLRLFRDHPDLSEPILDSMDPARVIKCLINQNGNEASQDLIPEMLMEFDPRMARDYLLKTRDRRVRSDDDEHKKVRRQVLAKINRRLGRTQLADRLEKPRRTASSHRTRFGVLQEASR